MKPTLVQEVQYNFVKTSNKDTKVLIMQNDINHLFYCNGSFNNMLLELKYEQNPTNVLYIIWTFYNVLFFV